MLKKIVRITIFGIFLIQLSLMASGKEKDIDKRVEEIHKKILSVDSHTDTPLRLMKPGFDISVRNDPVKDHCKVDFPRMKEGKLDGAFFAVFTSQGKRDPEANEVVKRKAMVLFDTIYSMLARNKDIAGLALCPDDAIKLKKEGKRAIFIGVENGYPIGTDIDMVKILFDRGARYITLCHTKNNDICDSSTDTTEFNGLSEFGTNVVKIMNRVGMMIDVSHISDKSFFDVLSISKAPVIASHSCSRALCNNPRNMSDSMLEALAQNGGVIQMCILGSYVKALGNTSKDTARASVSDVVDHIDHIVKVAGIDHVGIGTDFDGGGGVAGCDDVSEMKNITRELLKRGYSEGDIKKIWGGNLMSVMEKVSKVCKNLNKPCGCG